MKRAKPGFTLIEALSVVAIIGILVSLAVYVVTQAQRQARDTKRKSDLAAIAQGFEARFLDKTCSDPTAVGQYPGKELAIGASGVRPWYPTSQLSSALICNPFSLYLANIPTDSLGTQNQYYFNLSGNELDAEHYRLAARLEKEPTPTQWEEICRLSDVWSENFYGQPYDGCGGDTIARWNRILLAATLPGSGGAGSGSGGTGGTGGTTGGGSTGGGPGGTEACTAQTEGAPLPDECTETGGGSGGGGTGGGSTGGGSGGGNELFQLPYNYYVGR